MIEVNGLTRTYGSFAALRNVTFGCRPGTVTGFLGPNGAGKTTAMRVICGLTPPTYGTATVGGLSYRDIPNPGLHVGVLLDASAQHAGRTGREILALSAMTMGLPAERVNEMLEVVGLTAAESRRRLRNFSLGMRQRLGIANALMGEPKVLILDEPANGLDPAGIRWMRDLLRKFADDGGTVLLSSHLLHEVEQIADELILIGQGQILAQGTKEQLLASRVQGARTLVSAQDNQRLGDALFGAGLQVRRAPQGGLEVASDPETVGRIALQAQVALVNLQSATQSGLEDLFLELTTNRNAPVPLPPPVGGPLAPGGPPPAGGPLPGQQRPGPEQMSIGGPR